jgi:hypothetical protein
LLGLRGGGDGLLSKFIPAYRKGIGKFDGPPPTKPVIVLYDNDSGKKAVRSAIKDVTGRRPEDTDPFIHIVCGPYPRTGLRNRGLL